MTNTPYISPTTTEVLTSRISKHENLLYDEIIIYTSINSGIHSRNNFLCKKIRQLEPDNSDTKLWKSLFVRIVFEYDKVSWPPYDPLIEPATNFGSPIIRTHPHGFNFFIKFLPYGNRSAFGKSASILFTLFPGEYDHLFQWLSLRSIHLGIRGLLDPLNTWTKTIRPDQDPAYKQHTISTKTRVSAFIINNFIPLFKLFGQTEVCIFDGASFTEIKFSDPLELKLQKQTSLLFLCSYSPPIIFTSHWVGWVVAL